MERLLMKLLFSRVHLVQLAIVSVCTTLFFTILVPLQTFLANQDTFDYGAWDVLKAVCPWSALCLITLLVALPLCERLIGRVLVVVISGVVICAYLEIGVLSIGLPPLNGGILVYSDFFRKFLDFGIVCLVMLIWLSLYKWTKDIAHWAAAIVVVLMIASLFDVKKERVDMGGPLEGGYCALSDVANSVRFSRNGNIIVLVLDSFPASVASTIIQNEQDIRSCFKGFIAFDNNIGMHGYTVRGLPGLMTGRFIRPDESASDYMNTVFGNESLLYPYVEAGYPVYYSSDMLTHGYTNHLVPQNTDEARKISYDEHLPIFDRPSNGVPYLTLWDVCEFRLRLYRWKVAVLYRAYGRMRRTRTADTACVQERKLYPLLLNNMITNDSPKTLCVFHTGGVHQPVLYDRNGAPLICPSDALSAHSEYGVFVLRQVADFFRGLQNKGVYDRSLILICADHGLECLRKGDGRESYGSDTPMLWVKPVGASSAFTSSRSPTSNVKIHKLVLRAKDVDLNGNEIEDILRTRNRCFYEQFGASRFSHGNLIYFYKWSYDDNGHVVACENAGRYKCQ